MEKKPALSAAVLEALNEDNYRDWSAQLKTYLMAQDLWEIVESTREPPAQVNKAAFKAWNKTNAMALHAIQMSCKPDKFSDIKGIRSARDAWDTLAENYKTNLLGESEEERNVEMYVDIVKYLQSGDWKAVEVFLNRHPDTISEKITNREKTALHVATEAGHVHIVEKLVNRMSEDDLIIKDFEGFTALARATTNGNYRMAECMLQKNENLISIQNDDEEYPVVSALYYGHIKLARYLYSLTPPEILSPENENGAVGATVVCEAIYNKALDIALHLVNRFPQLVVAQDLNCETPCLALASMPDNFLSGNRLVFWKRWIYSGIHIPLNDLINDISLNIQNLARNEIQSNGGEITGSGIYSLSQPISKRRTLLGIEHLYEMKLNHSRSLVLLRPMKYEILISSTQQRKKDGGVYDAIHRAIKEGIFEFVSEIVQADPQLVWTHDEKSSNIFSVAVQYRQAKIFSLIYGLDNKGALIIGKDRVYGNTLLHTAGTLPPSTSFDRIAGAALQMQRELQWFKEVESIAPPRVHAYLNKAKLTPRELFTENHEDMRKDGEKWMKNTATSCTVVGALIITIMFAAVFTVPGVLMFLGILTSRYAEEDFLVSLPRKMIIGLSTLFISIVAMMITFSAGLFLYLHEKSWIFKPVICLASIPITVFVLMQFPLLVTMAISTYGPSIFNRKMKRSF